METYSNLKEFIVVKKKNFLLGVGDIVEECGTYEPALTDYVIVLNRDKFDDFRDYIKNSDIPNKDHTIKSLERIPAAVMRVMINRLNMESFTLGLINEYGGVQGFLQWVEESNKPESSQAVILQDVNEEDELENLFSEVATSKEDDYSNAMEDNTSSDDTEEDSEQFLAEKPTFEENLKTTLDNEKSYNKLPSEMEELQENVKYLIGVVNLLAVKNGIHVRGEKGILTANEILKFVASMRTYSDQQFRSIIEGVFLEASTEEQRRIVSDMLAKILNYIETRMEEENNE